MNLKKFLGLEYFTSGIDQFLLEFDQSHPKLSISQLAEKEKYDRIFQLRDHPIETKMEVTFWPNF